MTMAFADSRPPELVAATERPLQLSGRQASVAARTAPRGRQAMESLTARQGVVERRVNAQRRIYLNVEDLRADLNPGVVYGVYLNLPRPWDERARNHHHVGNVTVFGIEAMNDPDPAHDHVPGMRHTFDITRKLRVLRRSGRYRADQPLVVTFLLELPEPPPGYEGDVDAVLAESYENARTRPISVGRVSVFAG
jgi:tyrosinase